MEMKSWESGIEKEKVHHALEMVDQRKKGQGQGHASQEMRLSYDEQGEVGKETLQRQLDVELDRRCAAMTVEGSFRSEGAFWNRETTQGAGTDAPTNG
jgi:hypothetical protein